MELNIQEIRKLLNILSDELEKLDDKKLILSNDDLYWNIPDKEMYDPYKEPTDFTMGSLAEDCFFTEGFKRRTGND
ncbi:hypothetical protein [Chryseobacterium sp.]|uniref:hypothetical protein n=1 Tax=Chryseobacterium sp. TaxID=1871047 RepID=UPI00321B6771